MKQQTGLRRNTEDKYYTKENISLKYIKIVLSFLNIKKDELIIEPSAGDGSFMKYFENNNYKIIGYDILPEYKNIIKQDFLTLDIKEKNIHFIGNPPFGRQSSLAKKFIKKCCIYGKSISFILPKSFKKDSMKICFNKYFHLIYEEDIEINSFIINNNETINVPCVFQIWIKKNVKREIPKKHVPIYYKYVKKSDKPDFSLRRVGVYAGFISEDINKSEQSHYFIKLKNDINKKLFINKYKKEIIFNHNNTVGPKSISKNEFNEKINKIKFNIK